ncbi:LysR family transcriptional regulator [Actinoplanes subtropicus]|uniref:LysR family transcriptional regulator n=1 Tax=Actinoplanes subtropicus TaxID=543632 RepID=UPI0004C3A212|nr:LysR family transcriptional regulator [Actinoplanes subtropicus]
MKDVTLRQMEFLAETIRAGSLAGAAERLHLTGPAIAQQLRRLEAAAGLPLLERGPHGQRPTDAGRLLAETHARIRAELAACDEGLRALHSAEAGRVTVGAVSTAKYFTPHLIAAFRLAYPKIGIELAFGNREEIIARLEDYSVDLAIMGRPPQGLVVEQQVFGDHPYVIVTSPRHPLAGSERLAFQRVTEETFLVREHGSGTRLHLDAMFAAAGHEPVIGMELDSNETIKQAVMAGLGIALISAHTIAAEVHDGRLAILDVDGLPIHRHWLLVRMASRTAGPAVTALWNYVALTGADYLPTR